MPKEGKQLKVMDFQCWKILQSSPIKKKKKTPKTGHVLMKCVWNVPRRAKAVLEPKKG